VTARALSASGATRADLIGMAAMAAGNALLVVNDTFVKLAADALPMSQVICLRAIAAAAMLFAIARYAMAAGTPWPRTSPAILWRSALEMGTSFSYLYALKMMPIADLAGLQQITPLLLLAGAALTFGERIGWQGWAAAAVGLAGALLIVRPGANADAFLSLGAVLAILAVLFQVARDLLTRALPPGLPPAYVAGTSQVAMLVGALAIAPFDNWSRPSGIGLAQIVAAAVILGVSNIWLVTAMRSGRIALVAPFRYAGLLAALLSGWIVWSEFPDTLSLVGGSIIVASGLYSLRHRRIR
jgi:drug/metabolite transporter (DMT)-like permease